MVKIHFFLAGCLLLCSVSKAFAQVAGVEHVVVIGVDAMSPDGLRNAETPRMDQLMNEGAFSLHARAVRPTSSSPNWASIIMGAAPEQHGITSNGWERNNFSIAPVTTGLEAIFPTIFSILREQRPEAYSSICRRVTRTRSTRRHSSRSPSRRASTFEQRCMTCRGGVWRSCTTACSVPTTSMS